MYGGHGCHNQRLNIQVVKHAGLAGQACQAKTVAAIRRQVEINNDVIQLQVSTNVLPDRRVEW